MNLQIKFNKEKGTVAIFDGDRIVAEMVKQPTVGETLKYAELFQSSALMHDTLKTIDETLQQEKPLNGLKENLNRFLNLFTYNK